MQKRLSHLLSSVQPLSLIPLPLSTSSTNPHPHHQLHLQTSSTTTSTSPPLPASPSTNVEASSTSNAISSPASAAKPTSSSDNKAPPLPQDFLKLSVGQVFSRLSDKSDPWPTPTEDSSRLAVLQHGVVLTIRNIWADNTWTMRATLVSRLQDFRLEHGMTEDSEEMLDWAILCFVQTTKTIDSSKLTYIKHLAALYRRQDMSLPLCSMATTALRATSTIPTRQANPASTSDVDRLLLRASAYSSRLQTAIFIMFKTASRWDEVSRLKKESFLLVNDQEIIIEWLNNTKSTRLDPWRMSSWIVIRHHAPMTQYVEVIKRLVEEEKLVDMDTDSFVTWVQQDQATKHLSAQSFKRGAMTFLLEQALENKIPLTLLPRMAKHKHQFLDELGPVTLRYIADRVLLARAGQSHLATALIPCMPHPANSFPTSAIQVPPRSRTPPPPPRQAQQVQPQVHHQQQQEVEVEVENLSIAQRVALRRQQQRRQQQQQE